METKGEEMKIREEACYSGFVENYTIMFLC